MVYLLNSAAKIVSKIYSASGCLVYPVITEYISSVARKPGALSNCWSLGTSGLGCWKTDREDGFSLKRPMPGEEKRNKTWS